MRSIGDKNSCVLPLNYQPLTEPARIELALQHDLKLKLWGICFTPKHYVFSVFQSDGSVEPQTALLYKVSHDYAA